MADGNGMVRLNWSILIGALGVIVAVWALLRDVNADMAETASEIAVLQAKVDGLTRIAQALEALAVEVRGLTVTVAVNSRRITTLEERFGAISRAPVSPYAGSSGGVHPPVRTDP